MKKFLLAILFLFASPYLATAESQVSDVDTIGQSTISSCFDFSNNLRYRMRDANTNGEVSLLQDFLISKGLLSSEATGYFGMATFAAVKKFQTSLGWSPTGYFGPLTRAKVKDMTCGAADDAGTPGVLSPETTSASTNAVWGKVVNVAGKPVNGVLYCGDSSRNDYVVYNTGSANGAVGISKDLCTQKGGKVWVKCPTGFVASPEIMTVSEYNGNKFTCAQKISGATSVTSAPSSSVTPTASVCVELNSKYQCQQAASSGYKLLKFPNGNTENITSISDCTDSTFNYMTPSSPTSWNGNIGASWKACSSPVSTSVAVTATTPVAPSETNAVWGKVVNVDGKPVNGVLYCGDSSRNDYVVYNTGSANGAVGISKDLCTQKGGKVWVKCPTGFVASPEIMTVSEYNGNKFTCAQTSSSNVSAATPSSNTPVLITDYRLSSPSAPVAGYKNKCSVPAGLSSCTITLDWDARNITSPLILSERTESTPTVFLSQWSTPVNWKSSRDFTLTPGRYGNRFFLEVQTEVGNPRNLKVTDLLQAECASGSAWNTNTNTCAVGM